MKSEYPQTNKLPETNQANSSAQRTGVLAKLPRWSKILIIFSLVIFLVSLGIWGVMSQNLNRDKVVKDSTINSSSSISIQSSESEQEKQIEVDLVGLEIAKQLRSNLNLNMGFIYFDDLENLGHLQPVEVKEKTKLLSESEAVEAGQPSLPRLSELVPKPENPEKTNWLSFPDYGIEVPIIYASFQDMFESSESGIVDFKKPIVEDKAEIAKGNYESVPIQKLLRDGVVHLPFSVLPGELGSSYIVGHSSNFSSVKSNYNTIFKAIEKKSKPGDIFFIYDQYGRKLKFEVFEAIAISEVDSDTAYKNFPGRRTVTLQASILEEVNGKLEPTKRWLTRGELVLE